MIDHPKPRVLVVDDTPENIHVLMETLREENTLVPANSGEKALRLLAGDNLPDIILLDIMMPGIDGYEACRRIKQDERTRDIPIMFITALNQTADEAQGLALGAVDYITKPINPELVRARVRNHVALYRARQDILRRHRELARANGQLKHLNEQTREFLGIAVHDLKNPLTSIGGFADLLEMFETSGRGSSAKKLELLGNIQQSASHMLKIVTDLLASERLDSGRLDLDRQPHDLAELVDGVCALNRRNAEKKRIELILNLAPDCVASVDGQHMREVVDNLLSNAIKFSPRGRQVRLTLAAGDETYDLSIADQGPGLTAEDREKLFQRFQKLSARPTGGEPSSGLGLSIVKRLVELHGGTIEVASEPGQGATFTVRLPRSGAGG